MFWCTWAVVRGAGYGSVGSDGPRVLGATDVSIVPTVGAKPSARHKHAAAIVGDRLFVFGGLAAGEQLNDLHSYEVASGRWSGAWERWTCCREGIAYDALGPRPLPRHSASAVGVDNALYVFGGVASRLMNDLHRFDDGWHELATTGDVPAPREGAAIAASKWHIFVFGGVLDDQLRNDVSEFDIATQTWRSLDPPPLSPRMTSFAVLGDVFYCGGRDLWSFDSSSWTRLSETNHSSGPLIATDAGGTVLLYALDDHAVFSMGTWTDVARLADDPRVFVGASATSYDDGRLALRFGGIHDDTETNELRIYARRPVGNPPPRLTDRSIDQSLLEPNLVVYTLLDVT